MTTDSNSFQYSEQHLRELFALRSISGVGPVGLEKLLNHFESPSYILAASPAELQNFGLKKRSIDSLARMDLQQFDTVFEWLAEPNRNVIPIGSTYYPPLLAQTATPPLFLFTIGNIEHLLTPQIAVVGSRNPTPHGMANTQKFCRSLVTEGLTITSGLALGIDGEAHRAALATNGYTVAVTGTGLSLVYPARHRELAHAIAEQGLLVSECFPNESATIGSFPKRNRIIAGLSLGTLVIEAAKKSGSLITAHVAMNESREVFAVPGTISNPLASGCHSLIRQGAKLVENVKDIIEELPSIVLAQKQATHVETRPPLNSESAEFLKFVDYQTTSLDSILIRSQLPLETITSKLLLLELDGWIVNTTGGYLRL
ncbi:MAG: DNA-processing protein DprA [Kangiellaceae bacterium]|nr:DNA-processing protein DprA [Kangiellaceae bacterium]